MDDSSTEKFSPTVASILGIKGALRFRPHGSTQKAHVVLRRVEITTEPTEGVESRPMVYFSLFAQKRIEVKPGKEILLTVSASDGAFKEQAIIFEGDSLDSEPEESCDEEDATLVAEDSPSNDVVPPKMRKTWTKRLEEASATASEIPPKTFLSDNSKLLDSSRASIAVQAEPSCMTKSVQADTSELISTISFVQKSTQATEPQPMFLDEGVQTDEVVPEDTSLSGLGGLPEQDHSFDSNMSESERSLSPMDMESITSSPLNSPKPLPSIPLPPTPTFTAAISRHSSIASSSNGKDVTCNIPAPHTSVNTTKVLSNNAALAISSPKQPLSPDSPVVTGATVTSPRTPDLRLPPRLSEYLGGHDNPINVKQEQDDGPLDLFSLNDKSLLPPESHAPTSDGHISKPPSGPNYARFMSKNLPSSLLLMDLAAVQSHHRASGSSNQLSDSSSKHADTLRLRFQHLLSSVAGQTPYSILQTVSNGSSKGLGPPSGPRSLSAINSSRASKPLDTPSSSTLLNPAEDAPESSSDVAQPSKKRRMVVGNRWLPISQLYDYEPGSQEGSSSLTSSIAPSEAQLPGVSLVPPIVAVPRRDETTASMSRYNPPRVQPLSSSSRDSFEMSKVVQDGRSAADGVSNQSLKGSKPHPTYSYDHRNTFTKHDTHPDSPAIFITTEESALPEPKRQRIKMEPVEHGLPPRPPTLLDVSSRNSRKSSLAEPMSRKPSQSMSDYNHKRQNNKPRLPSPHPLPPNPAPKTQRKIQGKGKKRPASPPVRESMREPASPLGRSVIWSTITSDYSASMADNGDVGIIDIRFNRAGTRVAVGCSDQSIRILDCRTHSEIANLSRSSRIISFAWMRNDLGVVVLEDGGIVGKWTYNSGLQWQWAKLLDAGLECRSGRERLCFAYNVGSMDCLAIASPRSGVKIWSLINGYWQSRQSVYRQNVTYLTFMNGGDSLLGGTKDGVLWSCGVQSGTMRALAFFKSPISYIEVHEKETQALVTHAESSSLISLQQYDEGKICQSFPSQDTDHKTLTYPFGAAFAHQFRKILFGDASGFTLVWDTTHGTVLCALDHGEGEVVQAVGSYNPQDPSREHRVITGTKSGNLNWWSIPTPPT